MYPEPMRLYVATSNPGKLRDFALAASSRATIEPLPNLAHITAPPEDEPTFEGNARAKAIYYSLQAPGLLVLADDSGLEVDALGGAPGVYSARYATRMRRRVIYGGDTDGDNNNALIQELHNTPEGERQARYRCVLAIARDGKVLATADGTVEGKILRIPRGSSGFGYDPLFLIPHLLKTMAELDPATRLSLSHRGQALKNLLKSFTNQ